MKTIRAILQEEYSTATINRMLSAIWETVKQAWLLEQIQAERYLRIKQVNNVKGSRLPSGRHISVGEIKAITDVCIADDSPAGYRDASIIAWMVSGGGPRRTEVVSVDLADYDPESGQIKLTGEGNKERTCIRDELLIKGPADILPP